MDLIRPTYVINEQIARANIREMAQKAARNGARLRPHFKTHQSRIIGRWFREEGVTGITVSSLSMADYFAGDGWDDITVAFPVNLPEISLINRLASEIRLGLVAEDLPTVEQLDRSLESSVDLYIKIDSGSHRTGLEPDDRGEILAIADMASRSPQIHFRGLLTHAGHTYAAQSAAEVRVIAASSLAIMKMIRTWLPETETCSVSVGDTPSCSVLEDFGGPDEVRPGNFVFYDLMQMQIGSCRFEQVAGIVACPVVAVHPRRNRAVIYGGSVHLSNDRLAIGGRVIYGQLVEWDGTRWGAPLTGSYLVSLSQEHGILEAPASLIARLRPGSFVGIVPVHACLTANLLRGYLTLEGDPVDHLQGF
jgi:D-serine deaminase-like pyridoxal phosphate-dependent protein